ncbi:hypothetical protein, partial [uncultured Bacteroides sp.]|uniref:hypothetical protein n=1 Tax=uncultured Bacteroides sp. TaxID=162156 RepID=UPI002617B46C
IIYIIYIILLFYPSLENPEKLNCHLSLLSFVIGGCAKNDFAATSDFANKNKQIRANAHSPSYAPAPQKISLF